MFIDTHSHLDFPEFDLDRDRVINSAKNNGIDYIVNVGSSLEGSRKSVSLSAEYDFIYAAVGIHPHEADKFTPGDLEGIERIAVSKKVAAIGEIGLDYYKNYSKPENQRILFSELLNLAKELGLPVVIHSRQAEADVLRILRKSLPFKLVVHCFSGNEDFLKECLDLGFFISFTCNITYKKADHLRNLARITPLERIFLETDAPFLAPEGLRGKTNTPDNVRFVAEELARLKGISIEEVAKATSMNAKGFFNLK